MTHPTFKTPIRTTIPNSATLTCGAYDPNRKKWLVGGVAGKLYYWTGSAFAWGWGDIVLYWFDPRTHTFESLTNAIRSALPDRDASACTVISIAYNGSYFLLSIDDGGVTNTPMGVNRLLKYDGTTFTEVSLPSPWGTAPTEDTSWYIFTMTWNSADNIWVLTGGLTAFTPQNERLGLCKYDGTTVTDLTTSLGLDTWSPRFVIYRAVYDNVHDIYVIGGHGGMFGKVNRTLTTATQVASGHIFDAYPIAFIQGVAKTLVHETDVGNLKHICSYDGGASHTQIDYSSTKNNHSGGLFPPTQCAIWGKVTSTPNPPSGGIGYDISGATLFSWDGSTLQELTGYLADDETIPEPSVFVDEMNMNDYEVIIFYTMKITGGSRQIIQLPYTDYPAPSPTPDMNAIITQMITLLSALLPIMMIMQVFKMIKPMMSRKT